MSEAEYPWWKRTTIYQIYPRSFADGNADGTGDLEGIISRLDYLGDTGFETIWISPFFSSPQEDFGYDISGYRSIAPEYGDMDTCLRLIEEVHRREMKIVFDLVLNHTSRKHPWFIESRSSKDNPKRDWYIWKEGRGNKGKTPAEQLALLSRPRSRMALRRADRAVVLGLLSFLSAGPQFPQSGSEK